MIAFSSSLTGPERGFIPMALATGNGDGGPETSGDRRDRRAYQHPDHQLRIDRRATDGRIMRSKFTAKPGQIESSIDLPHQMVFRNRVAKVKLVEQLTLVTLQTAHHGSTSPRFASTQRNHRSWPFSTDFCNKIGTKRTCGAGLTMSAVEGILLQKSKVASVRIFGETLK